ncbi:hypothetical protein BGW80DRAFT_1136508, partial [Lactifluus volemus]
KLNDSRKLLGKMGALEDHKQWVLAVASGRVDRVASLVQAGLNHRTGIKALIQQYERAADRLYQPRGYSKDDIMRSIVLLRLGGARVAEFAHRSLALPSLTTIRRNTVLHALVVSPSFPTLAEIEANLQSCYAARDSICESHSGPGLGLGLRLGGGTQKIIHEVVMLDELATEKRIRWDDSTNKFLGTCREHNHSIPLDFTSERELDMLCDAIAHDQVHLASEATVAAIGALSPKPREYAALPILLSGTCKAETGKQHANLIKAVLEVCTKHSTRNNTLYRTVCIASDGEAKRGDALVLVTMSSVLNRSSPIYAQLRPLELMNFLVGPDDITADKDFKHVIKRQRNVLMRNKGIEIQGFCITPTTLRIHLGSNGVAPHRIQSLLNPNDKQDVILAYSLLKEVWSLPPPPPGSDPVFSRAREALNIYGNFARHLIMPYIQINLDLCAQLTHLSAAAHLAFFLFRDNLARTRFIPTQSYVDIMIMIKNVYFCVAKMKVDNPTDNFYLILLGTDRLETFFGLVRTAVGTDVNVDTLQLGSRASGLIEVAAILAEHPEWDHGTRRLTLPVISQHDGEISSKVDHITPMSWEGDVSVAKVNLHTCWLLGRSKAVELIPELGPALMDLAASDSESSYDILAPLGRPLVNQYDDDDEYDTTVLSGSSQSINLKEDLVASPGHPYTHDGDIEDAIADEMPRNQVTSDITIQGEKTSKARAL